MSHTSISLTAGILLLIAIVYYSIAIRQMAKYTGRKSLARRVAITICLWALLVTAWSAGGMMSKFNLFPFNVLPVVAIPLVTMIAVTMSKGAKHLLPVIPPNSLIALQSLRFFVEGVLWLLLLLGQLPRQVTFEGRNFDIIAGITAPLIAFLMLRKNLSRSIVVLWNLISLALLANIVSVAILSMPSPIRLFDNEPSTLLLTQFPGAFLPGLLVPLAYGLHFLSLRQLYLLKKGTALPVS